MRRSTERILTTHVGRIQRPDDITAALVAGRPASQAFADRLRSAVAQVVREQVAAGVDVPNDGEFGHVGWAYYLRDRLGGFELRKREGPPSSTRPTRDREEFAEYYSEQAASGRTYYRNPESVGPPGTPPAPDPYAGMDRVCTGPITYIGQVALQQDIDNLKAALAAANVPEGFMNATAPVPGVSGEHNLYYRSEDEFVYARAAALGEEFRAIVQAGLILQLDDPWLAEWGAGDNDVSGYERHAGKLVDLLNYSLEGIPEDRVRLHICYGSWLGPHSSDISLRHIVPHLLRVRAGAYSFEAANSRHEHEWSVWKEFKVPEGKQLLPGIVTHHTNTLEHPDLVAWRLKLYADVVGKESVVASTDCGLGYRVHPTIAWAKLRSLAEGARTTSEALW